jgi:hypothetical protein
MYVGDICVLLCRLLTLPVAEQVLLQSENYVTRRRSLKLLAEILLDRSNYTVMMRYISSKHNLKVGQLLFLFTSHCCGYRLCNCALTQTIMNLLRNKSSQIQLE